MAASVSFSTWHCHLGHVSFSILKSLCSSALLGIVKHENVDCASCELGKHHALSFNNGNIFILLSLILCILIFGDHLP